MRHYWLKVLLAVSLCASPIQANADSRGDQLGQLRAVVEAQTNLSYDMEEMVAAIGKAVRLTGPGPEPDGTGPGDAANNWSFTRNVWLEGGIGAAEVACERRGGNSATMAEQTRDAVDVFQSVIGTKPDLGHIFESPAISERIVCGVIFHKPTVGPSFLVPLLESLATGANSEIRIFESGIATGYYMLAPGAAGTGHPVLVMSVYAKEADLTAVLLVTQDYQAPS